MLSRRKVLGAPAHACTGRAKPAGMSSAPDTSVQAERLPENQVALSPGAGPSWQEQVVVCFTGGPDLASSGTAAKRVRGLGVPRPCPHLPHICVQDGSTVSG